MTTKLDPQIAPTLAEAREIAKDAYIYGFPMVQTYLTMYAFSIDTHNPQYKGPFNAPLSFARVFTPDDSAFVTPNSVGSADPATRTVVRIWLLISGAFRLFVVYTGPFIRLSTRSLVTAILRSYQTER